MPRVLAGRWALAMIARDKQHREVLAVARPRRSMQPWICFRPPDQQHLAALETSAHPGESTAANLPKRLAQRENQSVLITHRDAWRIRSFRRALAERRPRPDCRRVDREGHFELHALPLARRPPICEAELDVARCFKTVRAFCHQNQRGSGFTGHPGHESISFS